MGCQSLVYIGDNLTFSICTHDADTGALTDASAPPTYRVYEDETATAILTGTMATLDPGLTTGFYTELIACTTALGFDNGKSYTIYIEATVDGIVGGITFAFTVPSPRRRSISARRSGLTRADSKVMSSAFTAADTSPITQFAASFLSSMGRATAS
jgi:hypothetical protein